VAESAPGGGVDGRSTVRDAGVTKRKV